MQVTRPDTENDVCRKQTRIALPSSLLSGLRLLGKSKHVGITEIVLDVFREHVYAYRYGQQQQQPFNDQYYPAYLPSEDTDKRKSFHLMLPGDLSIIRHLARVIYQMTLNDFVIQILADRMAKELMDDPTLFLRHIPDY